WYREDTLGNRDPLVAAGLERWCDLVSGDWAVVADFLLGIRVRSAEVSRRTRETDITCAVNLDGGSFADIRTGLPFLDHMLEQVAVHAGIGITIKARGDLQTGPHHTVEDCAVVLGTTLRKALDGVRDRTRYGFLLPMDDALARVALDLGGRAWLSWRVRFRRESVGGIPTEMFAHFFRSLVHAAGISLHVRVAGENDHHRIEAVFKAVGRALGQALVRQGAAGSVPSSKGALQ
ncbi:MAG TPA: bifunctional histidinol-phosphatase/imidazoleglycerol-phosphate dehydratase, partial [Candidatus Aminicenantes bacterium]|nr:bifunctional histidinol-phosphatase/imidazoleglycerol-phosphate dehydratase [Candidatus Aminicenantes bacterium]